MFADLGHFNIRAIQVRNDEHSLIGCSVNLFSCLRWNMFLY
jgi:hypothetical protein